MAKHSYDDALRDPVSGELNPREVKRRAKGWAAVLVAFAVLVGGGLFFGTKAWNAWTSFRTATDYPGPGSGEATVVIPQGTSITGIGKILEEAEVIKSATTFKDVASRRPDEASKIQAGKYKLTMQIPAATAFSQLLEPERAIRNMLQLPEGQRLSQQVQTIAKGTGLSAESITEYVTTTPPKEMGIPDWGPTKAGANAAEGFLFPDTYEVPDGVKPETMVKRAITQFNAVTKNMDFVDEARNSPAEDPYRALIVASIIDREVFRAEDRSKVARVIYNRLALNMPLQLDSTVAYSVNKTETIWTTEADRGAGNTSPYNTYQKKGLPPGPISAPAEAALDAALHPDDGDWLYFVPVNLDTGETVFSADKAAHDASVAQLQAWCKASEANRKKCS